MPAKPGGKDKAGDFLGKTQHRDCIGHLGDETRPHPNNVDVFEYRKEINDHLRNCRADIMEKGLAFAVDELFGTDEAAPKKRTVRCLSSVKQSLGMSDHLFKERRVGFGD